jgi:hypothetical protein
MERDSETTCWRWEVMLILWAVTAGSAAMWMSERRMKRLGLEEEEMVEVGWE